MEMPNIEESLEDENDEKIVPFQDNITIFMTELQDGMTQFSVKSGEFFKNLRGNIQDRMKQLKTSWKKLIYGEEKKNKQIKLTKKLLKKYENLETKIETIESSTAETHDLASQIKEDTSQIKLDINEVSTILELVMDKVDDVETYMETKLGSDWQKIKNHWNLYKNGEIAKADFIKFSIKSLGKKFLGIFVNTSG